MIYVYYYRVYTNNSMEKLLHMHAMSITYQSHATQRPLNHSRSAALPCSTILRPGTRKVFPSTPRTLNVSTKPSSGDNLLISLLFTCTISRPSRSEGTSEVS